MDEIIKSRFKKEHQVIKNFKKQAEKREYDQEDKDKKHDAARAQINHEKQIYQDKADQDFRERMVQQRRSNSVAQEKERVRSAQMFRSLQGRHAISKSGADINTIMVINNNLNRERRYV